MTWFAKHTGHVEHAIVGLVMTLAVLLSPPWLAALLAVLGVALIHEQAPSGPQGDVPWSDFLKVNGGPWNGIWDLLTFLPAPVGFALWSWLT